MDKPESSYAQVRLFASKKEDEIFQQIVYVKNKFEEFLFLLDVIKFVYENISANKPILLSYEKYLQLFTVYHFFFSSGQVEMNIGDNENLLLRLKQNWDFNLLYIQLQKLLPRNSL